LQLESLVLLLDSTLDNDDSDSDIDDAAPAAADGDDDDNADDMTMILRRVLPYR